MGVEEVVCGGKGKRLVGVVVEMSLFKEIKRER